MRGLAICLVVFIVGASAGCTRLRTVTAAEFREIDRRLAMQKLYPGWSYLGTADGYHYIASGDDRRPRYRVSAREMQIVRRWGYEAANPRRAPLADQLPRVQPPREAWIDSLRVLPPLDAPIHDMEP